ncbi:MAG TPA: cell wall hydrolase [Burkholderiales bacterium]|nr:cell wall hydrolase [Burkholderiales bacterium]
MQDELKRVSEGAGEANLRMLALEQVATSSARELTQTSLRRDELREQLNKANSKIAQLSKSAASAYALHENSRTRLEKMQNELESAVHSAERSRAEAAEFKKQIADLRLKLEGSVAERHAAQKELQLALTDVEQLRSQLNATKSELVEKQTSLKQIESELEGLRSRVVRDASRKRAEGLNDDSLLSKQAHTTDLAFEARDYLIRTIVFEASGETEIGKAAVAHVILNRRKDGRWGDRIRDVVTYPWQFEPWMTRRGEIEKLSPDDPRYLDVARIADEVLAGTVPDPTAGATHFLNPIIVRQRRGGSLPSWAEGEGQPIGRHVFYSPEHNKSLASQAAAGTLTNSKPHTSDSARPFS